MDTPVATKPVRINRFLPYWAVLQADMRQTLHSWVYRAWVLLCVLAAVGYLVYRLGAYREAGMVQPATDLMSDLLRWTVFGSVTVITCGVTISAICNSTILGIALLWLVVYGAG